MKRFLTLLLLSFSLNLSAQSWQQLNDSMHFYNENGNSLKALSIAKKILVVAKNEFGATSEDYARALYNVAYFFNELGDKINAIQNYRESLKLRMKLYEPDSDSYFNTLHGLAEVYRSLEKWPEALSLYTSYLELLGRKMKKNQTVYAYTMYKKADLYNISGNTGMAEKEFLTIVQKEKDFSLDTGILYNTYGSLVDLYSNESNIKKAESIFVKYINWCRLVKGSQSDEYTMALYRLSALYGRGKDYSKAAPLVKQVLSLYYSKVGKNGIKNEDYKGAIMNYATLLAKMGNYPSADSVVKQFIESSKIMEENTPLYEKHLYLGGNSLVIGGALQQGEAYLLKGIGLLRKFNSPTLLAVRLSTLDSVYGLLNRIEERPLLLKEIINLHEKHHFLTDSTYYIKLAMLSKVYHELGDDVAAFNLADKIDSVAQKAFSKLDNHYLISRVEVARLYLELDRIDLAEKYYKEALELAPKILKDEAEAFSNLLSSISKMYLKAGNNNKAQSLLKQAIAKLEKTTSVDNETLANVWFTYAEAFGPEDNKKEEAAALRKAVEYSIKNKKGGADYLRIVCYYSSTLASFYTNNAQYEKADSIFKQILALTNKPGDGLIEEHLTATAQQGISLFEAGKKEKAAGCIRKTLDGAIAHFGENKEWGSLLYLYLSEYYKLSKQYEEAKFFGMKSFELSRKKYGENNPKLFHSLVILSNLLLEVNDFPGAEKIISAISKISLSSMTNNFDVLSENEKVKYLANKVFVIHFSNTLLLKSSAASPDFVTESMDQELLLKSLILAESRKITESVLGSGDTTIQNLYRQWLSAKKRVSLEISKPLTARSTDLSRMEEQAESLEKEITTKSSFLLNKQKANKISVNDLRKNLNEEEVAVEFVRFALFSNNADSVMYAAYILKSSDSIPIFVPLCEEKQLKKLFDSAGKTATAMVSKFYRGLEIKNKNASGALGTELYKLIWQPLEPYLKNVKKISYSPAGKLYSIAFHALPVDSTTVLMDKYQLQQYTSTRQVVLREQEKQNSKPRDIALFGDASFTLDSLQIVKGKTKTENASSNIYTPQNRGTRGGTWNNLPGTAQEVKTIQKVFEQNKITTKTFTQTIASEENLKALSGNSPQILHIATHGFFLPEPDKKKKENNFNNENTYTLADDPLLRSGLILSGGNYAWSGKTPIDGVEDGIATAYEISQLNLSNTELVVLSACETALGDVKGSEGVFGLQRAFKMAGVKKMIVSLWQVPDKETAELMTSFYSYWMKGKTINDAFAQSQADMRKKYSPFYWAAFVLVE